MTSSRRVSLQVLSILVVGILLTVVTGIDARRATETITVAAASGEVASATTSTGSSATSPSVSSGSQEPGATPQSRAADGGAIDPGPVGQADAGSDTTFQPTAPVSPAVDEIGVTQDEIRIGTVSAVFGPLDASFVPKSIDAYFQPINAAGGIGGRQIRLFNCDDGFGIDPGRTVACTRRLVEEDRVFALVGPLYILTFPAVAEYLAEHNVPLIAPDGVHPAEYEYPNLYHTNTNPTVWGVSMANHIVNELGLKRVAVLRHPGNAYDDAWWEAFEPQVIANGGEFTYVDDPATAKGSDCTPFIVRARSSDPDAFVLFVGGAVYPVCLQDQARQNWVIPTIGGTAVMGDDVIGAVDNEFLASLPLYANSPYDIVDSNPAMAEYKRRLHEAYPGTIISPYGVTAWIAARMFADAMEAISPSGVTRSNLYDHLNGLSNYDLGFLHPISYSPTFRSPNDRRFFYEFTNNGWKNLGTFQ